MKLKLQGYSQLKRVTFHKQICSLPISPHLPSPKQACRQSMGWGDDSPDSSAQTDSFILIICNKDKCSYLSTSTPIFLLQS